MRRFSALLFALLLVLAACGDDGAGAGDDTTTTTAADTTTTTAADTTTTTAATTTTTEAPGNPSVEAALELEGAYLGEWSNRTFGSSGPIEMTIEVDEVAEVAFLTLDLGGNVFGASDPDPIEYEVDLSDEFDAYEVTDDLFGESTWTIDADGHFVLDAPSVPGLGGLALTIEGDIVEVGAFVGTYTIPDLAEGEFVIAPTG